MSTPLEPAYVAGLFDGEGWLCLDRLSDTRYSHGTAFRAVGGLKMREKSLIEALYRQYGGSMFERKPQSRTHSTQYQWVVKGQNLRTLLLEIEPFLRAKKRQARLVQDFLGPEDKRGRRRSEEDYQLQVEVYNEMKFLNQKGIGKS